MQQPRGQTWNGRAGHHCPTPRRRPWSKPAKWLRLFFVPKHLVMLMLIIMYQTNTEHPAVTFTMNPISRINLHSNVEVFMLLTLCTNFQVFAHFALQFSLMKLYFWYLSCKHFPEITHQYFFCSPLSSLETASALLCVVKGVLTSDLICDIP